jgi:hypothetical protein
MRLSTVAMLLCLIGAAPVSAQPVSPERPAGERPVASEPAKPAETTEKDEGGVWKWFRTRKADSADKVEIPDRVERPLRVERPERAGGGCCQ